MNPEKNRIIEVVDYDKNWKTSYSSEAQFLKKIFHSILVSIHHIGSTSIPGMAAKPTIDILISVYQIEKVDYLNGKMKEYGYQAEGEFGIRGRRYFWKYPGKHKFHIHVFERSDKNIVRHLAFKAYLIHNRKVANIYSQLKKSLAVQYPNSIQKYMKGKSDLIKEIEREALLWYIKKRRKIILRIKNENN